METTNERGGNKTVLWIAGGCLALLVCVIAVVVFGFGGLYWLGSQSPENVNVTMDVPLDATVGDEIEFKVSVTNLGSAAVELTGIDISLNYLNGIAVDGTTPPYTETSQFSSLGGAETFQTFYFYKTIPAGEALTILFSGKAITAGDFSGSVEVCIDSDFNCTSDIARTIVK